MNRQTVSKTRSSNILVTTGLLLLWISVVIGAVFAEALWLAHPPAARGDLASIENHLVQKLGNAAANQKLGGAALVLIKNGEIYAEHVFGIANNAPRNPVKADQTLFQVASVSKAVTAWGVMKLVEEGRIGLDEPVVRRLKRWHFPNSEAFREKVTVRQLLSHTAGLDDSLGYTGLLPADSGPTPADSTLIALGPVVIAQEPGTGMIYSSGGYAVLQLLIEDVTGKTFADYMKGTVLEPLGMTKSSFSLDELAAENRLPDLADSFDADLNPQPRRRYTAAAGVALYATPRDLAFFARAYARENPVLKPETVRLMLVPQAGTGGSWGLGNPLFAPNGAGSYVTGHDGGTLPAWGAMMRINPATGNGMILTVSGGSGAVNQLGHDWLYWETGIVTTEARRQKVYDRLPSALAAIIAGGILILLWRWSKLKRKAKGD